MGEKDAEMTVYWGMHTYYARLFYHGAKVIKVQLPARRVTHVRITHVRIKPGPHVDEGSH